MCPRTFFFWRSYVPWGQILGRNWKKSFKSYPPCYSQSPLLMNFTPFIPPRAKVVLKNWFVMYRYTLYTETSRLRTLKIMSRNINEIVCSWIGRLLDDLSLERVPMSHYLSLTDEGLMLYWYRLGRDCKGQRQGILDAYHVTLVWVSTGGPHCTPGNPSFCRPWSGHISQGTLRPRDTLFKGRIVPG